VSGVAVRAVGVVTGSGRGVARERMRRATRECLLAVDAVDALLDDGGLTRADVEGAETALVYVTATAYVASNRAFIEGGGGALHFPYTAPSAVPAEVAIELGLHGPYTVLIGGAATTIDAIAHAATLLHRGACARALVVAVETFEASADVLRRGALVGGDVPVDTAAAVLLERGGASGGDVARVAAAGRDAFACAPLVALARERGRGGRMIELTGCWRGRAATTIVACGKEG
jgi:3-oxoacyl-[acyl-carrier-protein] synthase III